MVATDNHLGYKATDKVRGDDPFNSFEEILKEAKNQKVDFLLLGGDLFHEINPSQNVLFKTCKLFTDYIYGDQKVDFQFKNLDRPQQLSNFQDSKVNIDLPVFLIHGNHDYPSFEQGNLSVIDILQQTKLLTYFGRVNNYDNIVINPLLFQKGNTKIALYGIGYIKDLRMHHYLETNKVKFTLPPGDISEYFCILVIHQNRFKGLRPSAGVKNCVFPRQFPDFINLIIWGHEHESIPDIQEDSETMKYVYQPGSSTPTSLIEAEAKPKHVGLFQVQQNEFTFQPIFLRQTNRLMVYKQISLLQMIQENSQHQGILNQTEEDLAEQLLTKELEIILNEINQFKQDLPNLDYEALTPEQQQLAIYNSNLDLAPTVRIKVEYSGFDMVRIQKLEQKFSNFVANQGEIFKFWKKQQNQIKELNRDAIKANSALNEQFLDTIKSKGNLNTIGIENILELQEMYKQDLNQQIVKLKMLNPSAILDQLNFVDLKNRTSIFQDIFNQKVQMVGNQLNENFQQQSSSIEEKYQLKEQLLKRYMAQENQYRQNLRQNLQGKSQYNANARGNQDMELEDSSEMEMELIKQQLNTLGNYDYQQNSINFLKSLSADIQKQSSQIVQRILCDNQYMMEPEEAQSMQQQAQLQSDSHQQQGRKLTKNQQQQILNQEYIRPEALQNQQASNQRGSSSNQKRFKTLIDSESEDGDLVLERQFGQQPQQQQMMLQPAVATGRGRGASKKQSEGTANDGKAKKKGGRSRKKAQNTSSDDDEFGELQNNNLIDMSQLAKGDQGKRTTRNTRKKTPNDQSSIKQMLNEDEFFLNDNDLSNINIRSNNLVNNSNDITAINVLQDLQDEKSNNQLKGKQGGSGGMGSSVASTTAVTKQKQQGQQQLLNNFAQINQKQNSKAKAGTVSGTTFGSGKWGQQSNQPSQIFGGKGFQSYFTKKNNNNSSQISQFTNINDLNPVIKEEEDSEGLKTKGQAQNDNVTEEDEEDPFAFDLTKLNKNQKNQSKVPQQAAGNMVQASKNIGTGVSSNGQMNQAQQEIYQLPSFNQGQQLPQKKSESKGTSGSRQQQNVKIDDLLNSQSEEEDDGFPAFNQQALGGGKLQPQFQQPATKGFGVQANASKPQLPSKQLINLIQEDDEDEIVYQLQPKQLKPDPKKKKSDSPANNSNVPIRNFKK